MSKIDKFLLKSAAATLASNPHLDNVAVAPNGQAFTTKGEADRYAKKVDKVDNGGTVISRTDCAAEIAEIEGEGKGVKAELKAIVEKQIDEMPEEHAAKALKDVKANIEDEPVADEPVAEEPAAEEPAAEESAAEEPAAEEPIAKEVVAEEAKSKAKKAEKQA